jgi:iron(III) transport system ATP-binding protein
MSTIDLRSAVKRFGATAVLTDVTLGVPERSITAVLGSSGSGKTTLLRLIAGFETLDGGTLTIGDRLVDDASRAMPAQRRGVGYVPQEGALFPHLTVSANIGFGLARGDRARVDAMLELTGLEHLRKRYPHQLSGGQQQRVALARALAIEPSVLLLDEPFSALDTAMRRDLRRDVARIVGETGTTTILVTHDQDEALALADQVALLASGTMIATAQPRRLYRDPPDANAAASIGEVNIIDAHADGELARCLLGEVSISPASSPATAVSGACRLLLRPEQLQLRTEPCISAAAATVVEVQYYGHDALTQLQVQNTDGPVLLARVAGELELVPGQAVWIEVSGSGRAWQQ